MTSEKYQSLKRTADSIPSMGGRQIRKYIQEYVDKLKPGQAIVELGTWLGAATAQIALTLSLCDMNNPVYSYDRFIAKGRQIEKAEREGWEIEQGECVLEKVKNTLSVFGANINLIKGNITDIKYTGEKIGLYIDDAAKQKKNFDYAMKEFSPHFIPGETIIILMDYYLWKNTQEESHKYQYFYMQEHKENFEMIVDDMETSYQGVTETGAIFRYLGGL